MYSFESDAPRSVLVKTQSFCINLGGGILLGWTGLPPDYKTNRRFIIPQNYEMIIK